MNATPKTNRLPDVPIDQLLKMLEDTIRDAGPNSQGARILRREIASRCAATKRERGTPCQ